MSYSGSRFIFAVILLSVLARAEANAANSVRKNDQPSKYKTEEFIIDNFKIDGAFPAMTGPTKKKYVTLSTNPKARYIWVKGVGVDVFSDKKKTSP